MKKLMFAALLLSAYLSTNAFAHIEVEPYLSLTEGLENQRRDTNQNCYAISVPKSYFGKKEAGVIDAGRTTLFKVGAQHDEPLYTFAWYSRNLHLQCGRLTDHRSGISVIRVISGYKTPKPEPHQPVLEFYLDGKLIKTYEATDIVKSTTSYWVVPTGYKIFWERAAYRWIEATPEKEGHYVFEVSLAKQKTVLFDVMTGEVNP